MCCELIAFMHAWINELLIEKWNRLELLVCFCCFLLFLFLLLLLLSFRQSSLHCTFNQSQYIVRHRWLGNHWCVHQFRIHSFDNKLTHTIRIHKMIGVPFIRESSFTKQYHSVNGSPQHNNGSTDNKTRLTLNMRHTLYVCISKSHKQIKAQWSEFLRMMAATKWKFKVLPSLYPFRTCLIGKWYSIIVSPTWNRLTLLAMDCIHNIYIIFKWCLSCT